MHKKIWAKGLCQFQAFYSSHTFGPAPAWWWTWSRFQAARNCSWIRAPIKLIIFLQKKNVPKKETDAMSLPWMVALHLLFSRIMIRKPKKGVLVISFSKDLHRSSLESTVLHKSWRLQPGNQKGGSCLCLLNQEMYMNMWTCVSKIKKWKSLVELYPTVSACFWRLLLRWNIMGKAATHPSPSPPTHPPTSLCL